MARHWVSPSGNLYASTVVRLRKNDPPAPTLAFVVAVALHEAASALAPGVALQLKWPNDLLAGQRSAKVAGILLERQQDAVIAGVGMNLATHPEDLGRETTDLTALGHVISAETLCTRLATAFAAWRETWARLGFAPVRAAWLAVAHPVGTALSVRQQEGASIDGVFDGLESDGALRLRLADGDVRVIHAGDVFLV